MSDGTKPTVYLVDDDSDVRTTLSNIFRFHGFVIRAFATSDGLLNYPIKPCNACLILDLSLPGISGLELQRKILEQGILLPVVIYSGTANIDSAVIAMAAGAYTVLQKPAPNDKLLHVVAEALKSFKVKQLEHQKNQDAFEQLAVLSKREYEIAIKIADGFSSSAIADQLCLSIRTIETHRAAIFQKLVIKTAGPLAQLVLRADLHALRDK